VRGDSKLIAKFKRETRAKLKDLQDRENTKLLKESKSNNGLPYFTYTED
jgi:hypothetical protein